MGEIMVFQAGEVCARECEFSKRDFGEQCLGKSLVRDSSFSCDHDALVVLYKRGFA